MSDSGTDKEKSVVALLTEQREADTKAKQLTAQVSQATLTSEQSLLRARIAALSPMTSPGESVAVLQAVADVLVAIPVALRKYKLAALAHPDDRATFEQTADAELENGDKLNQTGTWRATILARARTPLTSTATMPAFRDCTAFDVVNEWTAQTRQLKADASQCASKEGVIDMILSRMFRAHLPHDMAHAPLHDELALCGTFRAKTALELLAQNPYAKITAAKQPKSEKNGKSAKQYSVVVGTTIAHAVVEVGSPPQQLDAIVDTGGSTALIRKSVLDDIVPDAPVSKDVPALRSFMCADGERRRLEPPVPARMLAVDVGAGPTRVDVYAVDQLAEPLILGVSAMRQLGGARVAVAHDASEPHVEWSAVATEAAAPNTPPPTTPPPPPAAAPSPPLDSLVLEFDAGIVELRGERIVAEARLHPERFLHFEQALTQPKRRSGRGRRRRKQQQRLLQRLADAHETQTATIEPVDADAHIWQPNLATPHHDAGADPTPIPTSNGGTYKYTSAQEHFNATVDAHPELSLELKEHLKAAVADIDGLNLQSSAAPPTPYGPTVGPGSVHSIVLRPGVNTNSAMARPRRVSRAKQRALDETRAQWLRFGIFEPAGPTPTRVLSAPVVVSKRDADGRVTGHRVAVDYRALNNLTRRDHYGPPNMQSLLELSAQATYVTINDGKSLFNQFLLDPATRDLARVIWYDGQQYDFIRAPFGLAAILATAQRFMDRSLGSETCKCYVDDAVLAHMSAEIATAVLELIAFYRRAAAAGIAINVDKLQLIVRRADLLGHVVDCDSSTFAPRPSRLAVLAAYERPTTNKALRSFLQMATFWQRFVPGWSAVMRRMTTCIRAGEPLIYTDDAAAAFEQAKSMLLTACERTPFDPTLPTFLTTDANKLGLGYLISQRHADGVERLIASGGRPTASFEQRLHVSELELLAFRTAIYRDAPFLVGLPIPTVWRTDSTIIMDLIHRRLPAHSEAVRRFLVELQHGDVSDIVVEHIAGSKNPADAVARQWDNLDEPKRESMRLALLLHHAMHPLDAPAHVMIGDADEDGAAESTDEASDESVDAGGIEIDDADAYCPPGTPQLAADESASDDEQRGEAPDKGLAPRQSTRRQRELSPPLPEPELLEPVDAASRAPPAPPALEGAGAHIAAPLVPSPAAVAHHVDNELNADIRRTAAATQADSSRWARELRAAASGRSAPRRAVAIEPFRDRAGRLFVRKTVRDVKAARWYVPMKAGAHAPDERTRAVRSAHGEAANGGGHRGRAATLARLRQNCWWPNMAADVQRVVDQCSICHQLAEQRHADGVLGTDDRFNGRLQHVHADIAEFEGGASGHGQSRYVLVVVDRVTAALEYAVLPDHKAASASRAFASIWLRRYGSPLVVTTDGARELVGKEFARLAAENGFKHESVSSRNPQANGMVERAIKTFKNAVRSFAPLTTRKGTPSRWADFLADARWSYMTAVSTARKHSPYELLYGKVPSLQLDVEQQLPAAAEQPRLAAGATRRDRDEHHALATAAATAAATTVANTTRKKRHEADRRRLARKAADGPIVLQPHDLVWLENNQQQFDTKFKNKIKRTGPYVIERADPERHRYQLRRWHNQLAYPGWVSVHRLSRCRLTSFAPSPDAPVDDDCLRDEPSLQSAPELTPRAPLLSIESPFGTIRDMREAAEGLEVVVEDAHGDLLCRLADTLEPALVRQVKRAARASRRAQRRPAHRRS